MPEPPPPVVLRLVSLPILPPVVPGELPADAVPVFLRPTSFITAAASPTPAELPVLDPATNPAVGGQTENDPRRATPFTNVDSSNALITRTLGNLSGFGGSRGSFGRVAVVDPYFAEQEEKAVKRLSFLDPTLPAAAFGETGGDSMTLIDNVLREQAVPPGRSSRDVPADDFALLEFAPIRLDEDMADVPAEPRGGFLWNAVAIATVATGLVALGVSARTSELTRRPSAGRLTQEEEEL